MDEQQVAVLIDLAKQATAKKCAEIAMNSQGTISQFMTQNDCSLFNSGCKCAATAIRLQFKLKD